MNFRFAWNLIRRMCGENRKAAGEAAIFYSWLEDEATNTHTLSEYKKRNGRKTTGISE
ncbi:hypothetical protein [Prevotella denticola]|uniref:hypothetical protein n=1 Tax=Prevotella denticola TaxID=28129 RepID=UPI001BA856F5|nr:hypothetical protein [Prevotella denticola]QUB90700.1 hypothetical protein J4855_10825 [Prevotella denticola]